MSNVEKALFNGPIFNTIIKIMKRKFSKNLEDFLITFEINEPDLCPKLKQVCHSRIGLQVLEFHQ